MKRAALIFTSQITLLHFFAGCYPNNEPPRQNRYGLSGDAYTEYEPQVSAPQESVVDNPLPTTPSPPPPPPPVPTTPPEERKYGIPVPGKPGFIMSPYAPYQGQIDARGFPPGTDIKDPYSGKIIYVP